VTDILIRDVPEDVIAAIDIKAQRLGLSRTEYLRRTLTRERDAAPSEVSVADLAAFADTFADLADPQSARVFKVLEGTTCSERKQFTYEPTLIVDE
jgi:hypothetical protein